MKELTQAYAAIRELYKLLDDACSCINKRDLSFARRPKYVTNTCGMDGSPLENAFGRIVDDNYEAINLAFRDLEVGNND